MRSSWKECLSRPSSVARLTGFCVDSEVEPIERQSPIDSFHASLRELLSIATPNFLASHPILGPHFLGGVVAATEEYLRSLLGEILAICPTSQAHAAGKQIHLGAALWHGRDIFSRGAFEGMAFTGERNVVDTITNFLDYSIKKTDRVWDVLKEFEKVCQIRHGVVHSGCTMPGKNAVILGLSPMNGIPRLKVGFAELQECADVCTSLAVSLNLDLFNLIAKRWASTWRDFPSWNEMSEHKHFKRVWRIFYSGFDANGALINSPLSMMRCKNAILKECCP